MFSKRSNKTKLPTIISDDTQCSGDIISTGEIEIDGQVIGDVHAVVLTVNKGAVIEGDVTASEIRLYGHIRGNVQARAIYMFAKSRIQGDVIHENITIEAGAFINGTCQHQAFALEEEDSAQTDHLVGVSASVSARSKTVA